MNQLQLIGWVEMALTLRACLAATWGGEAATLASSDWSEAASFKTPVTSQRTEGRMLRPPRGEQRLGRLPTHLVAVAITSSSSLRCKERSNCCS